MATIKYNDLDIVVYNNIIGPWCIIQNFIDTKISTVIRRATEEETIRHKNRPEENPVNN